MFTKSSDSAYSNYEGSFIVLYYEKSMRKRSFAKS